MLFAGIDYHKRYSVIHVLNGAGATVKTGRIEPNSLGGFAGFFAGFAPGSVRAVFESSMNWGYLYDLLHEVEAVADVTLANPYKTRVIAEAKIKTDKLDARWLAFLHRGGLIAESHASSAEARHLKELLRQRSFFVRQRTAIRNRVHILLGTQRQLEMPQVSDIFGKKGMMALRKLRFDQPHRQLMLQQDLDLMKEIAQRIREDERAVAGHFESSDDYRFVLSVPGIGPILGAMILSETDGVSRFPTAKKLLGYAGLAPTVSSSGGKTYHGRMIRSCNKWLKWSFVEAAWVAVGCDAYFGGLYRNARARGKGANTAITIVASRMATIVYHLLKERREFTPFSPCANQSPGCPGISLAGSEGG